MRTSGFPISLAEDLGLATPLRRLVSPAAPPTSPFFWVRTAIRGLYRKPQRRLVCSADDKQGQPQLPVLRRPMCGRPSVSKGVQDFRSAGWCGHVSDLLVRRMVPLAVMPFARLGSRSIARTRGAWVIVGFPDPAVSTGLLHQFLFALPNLVQRGRPRRFLTPPPARGSVRR